MQQTTVPGLPGFASPNPPLVDGHLDQIDENVVLFKCDLPPLAGLRAGKKRTTWQSLTQAV
ncbi:MAG: hypothetical protein IH586_21630 [Anaerolineaceae bacterium]|nr:hypothetical protein [Anaerolineaceae bacterium]